MRSFTAPLIKGMIFVVVTGLATAVLAISISNKGLGETDTYTARFTSVAQLEEDDDVRISGVRVGQVEEMRIVDGNLAEVTFSVEQGRPLPADVTATIKYRNMVGQRYIELGRGENPSTEELAPDAVIPLERTMPALDLTDLFNGFKPLFRALSPEEVNTLSGEIIQVLQGEGATVESLLAHTASLTSTVAEKDQVIGEVITNLNSVLKTINAKGDQLATLISTVQQLTSGLAEDREPIGEAISGLGELTTATGGLLQAARPPLKESIAGLEDLAGNLAENEDVLDSFLDLLPRKFTEIGRTTSYGSWLNLYLCEATLQTDPPQGLPNTAARCQ